MQRTLQKRANEWGLAATLLLLLLLAVSHITLVTSAMQKALALCANALIPTLFPFLIITDLLLSVEATEKMLFRVSRPFSYLLRLSPTGGAAFLLGAVFGFPMGAKAVAHYYGNGELPREEAERLLLFSGNASPFFLIGSVGGNMLFSTQKGVALYLLQLAISLACGVLLGLFAPKPPETAQVSFRIKRISFSKTVQNAVRQSLFISGYVLFFSVVLSIILPYLKSPFLVRLFACLLEISNACAQASEGKTLAFPFCAFATCFSGLSVYFQTLDCIEGTDLSTKSYLPVKLLCGFAGFFLALPFSSR